MNAFSVNVDHLIKIRKARSPIFRLVTVFLTLYLAWAIWNVIHGHKEANLDLFVTGDYVLRAWVFFTALIIFYSYLLFRKGAKADWVFVLAESLWLLLLIFILIVILVRLFNLPPDEYSGYSWFIIGVSTFGLYQVFWLRSRWLWLSSLSLKSWRKYGIMRQWLDEAKKERKGVPQRRTKKRYSRNALLKFSSLMVFLCFQGVLLWAFSFIHMVTGDVVSTVREDKLLDFWKEEVPGFAFSDLFQVLLLFISGYLSFVGVGYKWNRLARGALKPYDIPLSKSITENDILYLRNFDNEIKYVSGRRLTWSRLLLISYPYNFSLEEIIQNRLRFTGNCYTMGSTYDLAHEGEYLQPLGIPRYYSKEWEIEVQEGMKRAQMIVLIMGKGKEVQGEGLKQEILWIKTGDFLDKTLFLFPLPDTSFKSVKSFWQSLVLFKTYEDEIWKEFEEQVLERFDHNSSVQPKRIIGVCFFQGKPVLLFGKNKNEVYFESALDMAGKFINAPDDEKYAILNRL